MLEFLSWPYMQRALIAGLLVGALASYYGVFLVQRRMAFLGSGLAHAAFGGVALGLLLGANPLWIAIPYTIAVAIGIVWVRDRAGVAADTAIGIFFALSMALGILFLSMKEGYTRELSSVLFGSLLSVDWPDIGIMAALVVVTALAFPMWARWAYATFDPTLARVDRHPVTRDDYLLTVLTAITIVAAVKTVGIILVAAFLVLPAATARVLCVSFATMTLWAVAVGVTSAEAGLIGAYHLNLPSGAAIVLLQGAVFFLALLGRRLVR
jgi:zinc transport system permease protein